MKTPNGIPQAPSSTPGLAVEASPDAPKASESRMSRRGILKLLAGTVAAGAVMVGPNVAGTIDDSRRARIQDALKPIEKEPHSKALIGAQTMAALKLFGTKGRGVNVDKAKQIATEPRDDAQRLVAADYLNPEQVDISRDGKTFIIDGQTYSLGRIQGKEGVFILAGRAVRDDKIDPGQTHFVSPLLVGGAKADPNLSQAELEAQADDFTKGNLASALSAQKVTMYDKLTGEPQTVVAQK